MTRGASCPTGYTTTAGASTFTQSATQTTTTTCPGGAYGSPSTTTSTSAWSPTPAAACPVATVNQCFVPKVSGASMAVGGEPTNGIGPVGVTWVPITKVSDCTSFLTTNSGSDRGGFWPHYHGGSIPNATAFCTRMLQDFSAQQNGQAISGTTIDSSGEITKWFAPLSNWYGLNVSDIPVRVTSGPAIAPFDKNTGAACTP